MKAQPEHKTKILDKILLLSVSFRIFSAIDQPYETLPKNLSSLSSRLQIHRFTIPVNHVPTFEARIFMYYQETLGISVALQREASNPMYSSWPCIWMKTWLVWHNERWMDQSLLWPHWTLCFLDSIAPSIYSRVFLYMRIGDSCFLTVIVPRLAAQL